MDGQAISQKKFIDTSTIIGILVAFALVSAAIIMGGNAQGFFDMRSVLIVVFGTFAVTAACFSFSDVGAALGAILRTIFYSSEDAAQASRVAVQIAEIARKRGLLELDKHAHLTRHNPFLRNGIEMVIDHVKIEEIEKVLSSEVESLVYRHSKSVAVLRKAAEVSPAMGLIGTLIGLVQMLSNLSDTSTIGPAMAVALLTTFYGAILSYMFFAPVASKLERNTRDELLVTKVYIQAVKSIARRESHRKLELVLNSILPPTKRVYTYSNESEEQS